MIIRICNSTADINVFSLPLLCAPFNLKCALTAIESQPTMILAKLSGLQKIFAQLQAGPVSAYKKKLLFVKVSAVRQRERKQILTRQRHGVRVMAHGAAASLHTSCGQTSDVGRHNLGSDQRQGTSEM